MNDKNIRLVTAESVRAGHPDKLCDQVADAILDAYLRQDPNARVAVEVFSTAGKMLIGGEITSKAKVDCGRIVADTIDRIGYTMGDLCEGPYDQMELEIRIHDQSPDISAAVGADDLGAGDQGIVVGYATNETAEYLPLPVVLAHRICKRLDELKPQTSWLGADGKAQVTKMIRIKRVTTLPTLAYTVMFVASKMLFFALRILRLLILPSDRVDSKFSSLLKGNIVIRTLLVLKFMMRAARRAKFKTGKV